MVDVMYRNADGKGTRLYARMPTLDMASDQFRFAVKRAETNPRCPYVMLWIRGHEKDYCWIKGGDTP